MKLEKFLSTVKAVDMSVSTSRAVAIALMAILSSSCAHGLEKNAIPDKYKDSKFLTKECSSNINRVKRKNISNMRFVFSKGIGGAVIAPESLYRKDDYYTEIMLFTDELEDVVLKKIKDLNVDRFLKRAPGNIILRADVDGWWISGNIECLLFDDYRNIYLVDKIYNIKSEEGH